MDNTLIYPVDSDASTIPESDCETDSDGRQDQSQFQSIPPNNTSGDQMKPANQLFLTQSEKISEQPISCSSSDDCDSQNILQSQRSQRPKRKKKRPLNHTVPLEVSKRNEMQKKAKSVWQQLNKEENRLKVKQLFKKACSFGGVKNLKSSQTRQDTSTSENISNSFDQSRSPVFIRGSKDKKLSLKKSKSQGLASPIIIDSEESPAKNNDPQSVYEDISSDDSDCVIMSTDETAEPSDSNWVIPKSETPKPSPTFSARSATLDNVKTPETVCLESHKPNRLNVTSTLRQWDRIKTPPVASYLSEDSWGGKHLPISTHNPKTGYTSDTNKTTLSTAGNKPLSNSANCSKMLSDSQMFTEDTNNTVSGNVDISECIDMLCTEEETSVCLKKPDDNRQTRGLFYTSSPKPTASKQKLADHAVTTKAVVPHAGEPEVTVLDDLVPARVGKEDSVVEDVPVGKDKPDDTAHISYDGVARNQVSSSTGNNLNNNVNKPCERLQEQVSTTRSTTHNTTQEKSSTATTCRSTMSGEDGVEIPTTTSGPINQLENIDSKKSTDNGFNKSDGGSIGETDQQIPNITVSLPSCDGSNVDLAVVKEETTKDQEEAGKFQYSVIDTVVHVFDSDDEELFYTQSVFGSPHRGNKASHDKNSTETLREDPGGLSSSSTLDPDTGADETMDFSSSEDQWEDDDLYMAHTQVDYIQDDQEDTTANGDTRDTGKLRSCSPMAEVDSPNWDLFNEETQIDPSSPEVTSPSPERVFEVDTQPLEDGVAVTDSDNDDPYLAQTQADSVQVPKEDVSNIKKKMVEPLDDILPSVSVKFPKRDVLSAGEVMVEPYDAATQKDSLSEDNVNLDEDVYSIATQHGSLSGDNVDVDEDVYNIATQHDSLSGDNVDVDEDLYSNATLVDSPDASKISGEDVEGSEDIQINEVEERDVMDCYQMETQVDDVSALQKKVSDSTLHKIDNHLSLHKGDRKSTLHKGERKSTLHKGDRKSTLHKGDRKSTLHKADRKSTLHKGDRNSTLHKGDRKSTLHKGDRNSTLHKGDNHLSLHKGDSEYLQSSRDVTRKNTGTKLSSSDNDKAEKSTNREDRLKHTKNLINISSKSDRIVARKEPDERNGDNFSSATQVDKEETRTRQTTTKLQECSKDSFDVSESNIVEFMASTQVDPSTVTTKVKRYLFFPKKKVGDPKSIGLFDKFSAEFKKVNECSAEFKKVDEPPSSDNPRSMGSKTVTSKLEPMIEEALSSNIQSEAKLASIPSGAHYILDMPHKHMESPDMPDQDRESPDMPHQDKESPEVSPEEELSSSLSDISEDYFSMATQVDSPGVVGEHSEQNLISSDMKTETPSIENRSFQSIGDKKERSAEEKRTKSDVSCSKSHLTGKTSELLTAVPSKDSVKEVIEKKRADVFPGDYRLRKNYISCSLGHRDETNVRHPLKNDEASTKPDYKGLCRSKSADPVPEVLDKTLPKLTPSIPLTKCISIIASKNESEGKDSSTSIEAQNELGAKKGFKGKKRSFSSVGEYASLSSAEKDKSTEKSLKSGGNTVQPESPTKPLQAIQSVKDSVPKKAALTCKLPPSKRSLIDVEQSKSPVKRQKNVNLSRSWLASSNRRMKQKDPKKKSAGTPASISLNIAAARQCMLEREMKASSALHTSNTHQSEKTAHHNDEEDVEMPCTQDIMARGLPILTARLPVNKTKLNLGLPSQGRVASEDKQNSSVASGGNGKSETELNEKLMRAPSAVPAKSTASVFGAVKESSPSVTGSSNAESSVRISSAIMPNSSDKPGGSTVKINMSSACVSSTHDSSSAVLSSEPRSSLTPCQKSSVGVSVKPTKDQALPRSILKQPDKLPERKTVNFRDSQNTFKFIEPVSRPFREMLNNVPQLREVPQSSPEFITSVLLKILGWNTIWLQEYDKVSKGPSKAQQPPPLLGSDDKYSRLRMYFETFKEYLAITSNLLILETWESIFQDWKHKIGNIKNSKVVLDGLPYYPTGKDGKKEQVPLVIEVIGVTSRRDRKDQLFQDDFLILKGFGKPKGIEAIEPNWKEQFALVQGVKILGDKDIRWLNKSYPHLQIDSSLRDDILIYKLTLKIKYQVNYFPSKPMEIKKISNLKTLLRQLEALTLLPDNPLCGQLLCPSEQNVFYHDPVDPGKEHRKLNTEQAKAVASIKRGVLMSPKAKKLFFLQGPAGTGKTQTIMALIHQILLSSGFKARICLATPSNAAVDEIAKRIIQFSERLRVAKDNSISLVRIGNRDFINPAVKPFYWETLVEEQCKAHSKRPDSLQDELEYYRRQVSGLKSELADPSVSRVQKASKDADLLQYTNKIKSLESELRNKKPTARERYQAKCSVMDNAHVICGTLSSFGLETVKTILLRGESHRHKDQPFTCLIIDEATQAIEVDCLIPLQYKMTKVVLVGDQKQLPATVLSQKANELELGRSLFERLNLRFEEMQKGSSFQSPIMMLVRQYRMNPEVLALPNNLFYDGKLKTDDSVLSRKSFLAPYLVFDVQGGKEFSNERSLSNVPEAECTASLCSVVMEVLKESPSTIHKRIGVICPYADQKQTILKQLRKRNLERIEVNTVDGFQGQERDVIIMSCVRAQNNPTTIGFLADKRRMNVALTRAKLAMYVMGHFETLKTNGLWSELYQDACNRKLLVDIRDAGRFSSVAGQRLDLNKHSVHLDR